MSETPANQATSFVLTCPECGSSLGSVPDAEDVLCCPSHHRYTLPELLVGQSRRVASLCEAGARLLEEQERLVRQIAHQLWNTRTLTAFKLEGQADRLKETMEALRIFIREGVLGGAESDEEGPLLN